ncbi:MAG: ArsJ-associated glyceraldehyde-3-phosphate dehydrogenase [Porticoccaceae bacterium]|nr:ArsJ-associated glyceraldehyde-3-phosphate dehydrogenase [Porticoccaceae bacterium]
MTIKVGINGFGRIGRLALRAAWDWPEFDLVLINDIGGDTNSAAHLLEYDSVHGHWDKHITADANTLVIDGKPLTYTRQRDLDAGLWSDVDVVVDCTGKFKTQKTLAPYLAMGVKKVVVSAPVKDGTLNIVMGVNDHLYQADTHHIVTAASCTTNCLAPIVDVIHAEFGIKHGSLTTIHAVTNTQSILDEFHPDLRRARACGSSLIPTSTGSATAIFEIFPELKGRLNGLAVRVPLANASLTDCVFEVETSTSVAAVNGALKAASEGRLKDILGYEEKPLVSVDYTDDPRSSIIDALSTMVINDTQVKILSWYDNEVGYANRLMELVKKVSSGL